MLRSVTNLDNGDRVSTSDGRPGMVRGIGIDGRVYVEFDDGTSDIISLFSLVKLD